MNRREWKIIRIHATLLAFLAFAPSALAYYNPSVGRWLNRDPIEESGGVNIANFAENRPISMVDPFGLDLIGDWMIAGPEKIVALDKNYPKSQSKSYYYLGGDRVCRWGVSGKLKETRTPTEQSIEVYPTDESTAREDSSVTATTSSGLSFTKKVTIVRPKFVNRRVLIAPKWTPVLSLINFGMKWTLEIQDQFGEPMSDLSVTETISYTAQQHAINLSTVTGTATTNSKGEVDDVYLVNFTSSSGFVGVNQSVTVGNWSASLGTLIYATEEEGYNGNLRSVFR